MWRIWFVSLLLVFGDAGVMQAQRSGRRGFADKFEAGAERLVIRNLRRVNSPALDFSPAIYQNGIVFVTSRPKGGLIDMNIGETFFELYYAEMDPDGVPQRPRPFSIEINSRLHEGPVAFTADGDKIFFTRNNMTEGLTQADREGKVVLKIYEADRGFFDWENIRELPFNSNEFSCMHPSISEDGRQLYFASNRPGGYGGLDIYVSELVDGSWSEPINLGPDINTSRNDVFPFIHPSGTLFFASEGHRGLGGLDLFMIDISASKWGELVNLGEGFNSKEDDFGLVLDEDGQRGFFSSNRNEGVGKDDLYMFEAPDGMVGMRVPRQVLAGIEVREEGSNRLSRGVSVRVFELASDGLAADNDLYDLEFLPASDGINDFIMSLRMKQEDQLGEPLLITDNTGRGNLNLDPRKKYLVLVSKPGFVNQEVVIDPEKQNLSRPLNVQLERLDCITLTGTVTSVYYGKPVPNTRVKIRNGCDGKEAEVRTDLDGNYTFCLEVGCDFALVAEQEGYRATESSISTANLRGSRSFVANMQLRPETPKVVKEPLRAGTRIVLENIYYDFNKSSIRTGEARDLEALARLMEKYPTMEVELGAHTDTRGPEAYNQRLSLERAESARQFLLERGIVGRRIVTIGYGESQPRNKCLDGVPCSEEEHQYNRRTEVRITRINEPVSLEEINKELKNNR